MKLNHFFTKYALLAFIIIVNIGCDQKTKQVAQAQLEFGDELHFLGGTFKLMYAENPGAFLGWGENLDDTIHTVVLEIIPSLVLITLLCYIFLSKKLHFGQAIAFSFIIGGGISNVFDRIVDGKVIDFMNLSYGQMRTGTFNMADIAIMLGMFLLLWFQYRTK